MARLCFIKFNIRLGHGKTMTSHYSHKLPNLIGVGEFVRPVYSIFQTVFL